MDKSYQRIDWLVQYSSNVRRLRRQRRRRHSSLSISQTEWADNEIFILGNYCRVCSPKRVALASCIDLINDPLPSHTFIKGKFPRHSRSNHVPVSKLAGPVRTSQSSTPTLINSTSSLQTAGDNAIAFQKEKSHFALRGQSYFGGLDRPTTETLAPRKKTNKQGKHSQMIDGNGRVHRRSSGK